MRNDWKIRKLGDIGNIFNGNSINAKVKKDKYLNLTEGFPYIATKDVSFESKIDYDNGVKIPFEEKTSFKIARKNTILICAEGGSAGRKIGFIEQDVCFGNKLFAFYAKENIESRFVYYYYFSLTFQNDFKNQLTGIIGGVSKNKFENLEIPIPPLSEQKRIVAILDKAFAAIDKAKTNTEKNLENAKELFESYLQDVFEKKGDGWSEKTLETVSKKIFAGGDVPKNNLSKQKTKEFNIPIFSNGMKDKGLYGYTNIKKVIEPSITISARGTIGYSEIRNEPFYPVVRLVVVIPNTEVVDLFYLKHIIGAIDFRNSGTSIPQLTVPMVKKYVIPVPPLSEQKKIVEKLELLSHEIKKVKNIYQEKKDNLEILKKSTLQKAFSGELTK